MREGPLAALFRKTDEVQEKMGDPPAPAAPPEAAAPLPPEQPEPQTAPRTPTPQERLRHAFSSDLPDNMLSPPEPSNPR
jgi:cell division protein FtsZ